MTMVGYAVSSNLKDIQISSPTKKTTSMEVLDALYYSATSLHGAALIHLKASWTTCLHLPRVTCSLLKCHELRLEVTAS